MQLNENFRSLPTSYVFEELAKMRVSTEKKRGEKLIDLGIGDIKLPLFGCVSEAMKEAAEKLTLKDGFIGYPPATGFDFLKDAIIADYAERGVKLSRDEIFINDGAKTELFAYKTRQQNSAARSVLPRLCRSRRSLRKRAYFCPSRRKNAKFSPLRNALRRYISLLAAKPERNNLVRKRAFGMDGLRPVAKRRNSL